MDFKEVIENFNNNGFECRYFDTAGEAKAYLKETLKGETIRFGGSMTLDALNLYDELAENNTTLWHWRNDGRQAAGEAYTVYMSSANALSETGEVVNIDGNGNRLAGTIYGCSRMIIVAGINKLTPDLESAIYRARNVAAPLNARRFKLSTPCTVDLKCHNCKSPQRICKALSVFWRAPGGFDKAEVILIGEELGY